MALKFRKATKAQAKLRMAFVGPAGTGKTYSALNIARHLGERIAVIDTEHGSASKYASGKPFDFDALDLETYEPETYIEAIEAAENAGYDVIVIDSLSHAWIGKGGALELADAAGKRGGNSFTAWKSVTPRYEALLEKILASKCHVIVTIRAKTEYVQEKDERGKSTVRKVGMAPVLREGSEFSMDIVGDMTAENDYVVSKSRCPKLTGQVFNRPGKALADVIKAWLSDGDAAPEKPAQAPEQEAQPVANIGLDEAAQVLAVSKRINECATLDAIDKLGAELRESPPFAKGTAAHAATVKLFGERRANLRKAATDSVPQQTNGASETAA
jgi:hypothetical protein